METSKLLHQLTIPVKMGAQIAVYAQLSKNRNLIKSELDDLTRL